jgi:coenzyme Q-binding protein COQ10
MTTAHKMCDVPYNADDMFLLVADVGRYSSFLPWCIGSRIRRREIEGENAVLTADMIIAYKIFREQFTSRVILDNVALIINVHYTQGPLKYLTNKWRFEQLSEGGSRIHFFIDFEFKNQVLQKLMNGVSARAFPLIVQAFIDHASELYG